MEPWILYSLGAATSQTARFMLQKQLKSVGLSNAGATFARFVYTAPVLLVLVAVYLQSTGAELPSLSARFWGYALVGAVSQILATVCVVALFGLRNFAVGITFKKTEVVLTAIAGFLVLGETVSYIGAAALALGLVGVLMLADPPGGGAGLGRFFNKAAGLGIVSGLLFAASAVGYGGATRAVGVEDTLLQAGLTLAVGTAVQTALLGAWMVWRERGEIGRVFAAWRISGAVGVTSMIGSFCWFAAFSLQNVAYVFAVGQVELILSLAASALVFREVISRREVLGIAVLGASILLLVFYRGTAG